MKEVFTAHQLQRAIAPRAKKYKIVPDEPTLYLVVIGSSDTTFLPHSHRPFLPHHLLLVLLHWCIHSMPVGSSGTEGFSPINFCRQTCTLHDQMMFRWIIRRWRSDHPVLKTFLHLIIVEILPASTHSFCILSDHLTPFFKLSLVQLISAAIYSIYGF